MNPIDATKSVVDRSKMEHTRVARMAGINPHTLDNYLGKHSYPNIAVFAEICKACGVTVTIKDGEVHLDLTENVRFLIIVILVKNTRIRPICLNVYIGKRRKNDRQ